MDKQGIDHIIDHVAQAIDASPQADKPFLHLTLKGIFPPGIYQEMMQSMPDAGDYRALPGRNKRNIRDDGVPTRIKMDLLPEYIRKLPAEKRKVWDVVGKALCAPKVRDAFIRKLAPRLERRFGKGFEKVGMYPIPILTRDTAGYVIGQHTDTRWKGITVQFYLPKDESHIDIGTVFHGRDAQGGFPRDAKMKFVPNSGYAFAVDNESWHSVDRVGPEVKTRDSILLTYFVDQGPLMKLRNRFKRVGNFILNEAKSLTRH